MPQTYPDGTTKVEEVVVIGNRTTRFTIYPPSRVLPSPPLGEENPSIPDSGGGGDMGPSECEKEVGRDRAGLEAAQLVRGFPDNGLEYGYYLVEDADGGVRSVGPVEGYLNPQDGRPSIDWDLNIVNWAQANGFRLVGLVHNHPRIIGQPGYDSDRRDFSDLDVIVTQAMVNRMTQLGMDPSAFRQYIVVGDDVYKFGQDAEAGDPGTSANEVLGENNCV